MRVLLRDLKTGLYAGREVPWVRDLQEAEDFRTVEVAGRRAWKNGGENIAVVLRYEDPECELALNPIYCLSAAHVRGVLRARA
jgi:hypothetical protein